MLLYVEVLCVHTPSSQQPPSRWGWPLRQTLQSSRRTRPTEARSNAGRRRLPAVERRTSPLNEPPSPGARSRPRLRARRSEPAATWIPDACRVAIASSSIRVSWNSAAVQGAATVEAAVTAARAAAAEATAEAAWRSRGVRPPAAAVAASYVAAEGVRDAR